MRSTTKNVRRTGVNTHAEHRLCSNDQLLLTSATNEFDMFVYFDCLVVVNGSNKSNVIRKHNDRPRNNQRQPSRTIETTSFHSLGYSTNTQASSKEQHSLASIAPCFPFCTLHFITSYISLLHLLKACSSVNTQDQLRGTVHPIPFPDIGERKH